MAEATKSTVVRTVTEETFTLTLSADEFRYLRNLVGERPWGRGEGANGRVYDAMTKALRTAEVAPEPDTTIRVGDRVRVLRATFAEELHGRVGTVLEVDRGFRADRGDRHPYSIGLDDGDSVYAAEVEHVGDTPSQRFYDYNGVTYDLTAEYRDTSDDNWYFTGERSHDGYPLMSCRFADYVDSHYQNWPLPRVLAEYTLTRV